MVQAALAAWTGRKGIETAHTTEVEVSPGIAARAVLDAAKANIFVADTDLNLVYMNPTALRTATTLAPEIERVFKVPLRAILGGSIHRFHQDPARIERILHDPSALPRNAQFTFGAITLDTRIDRITGPTDAVIGYVVAWEDISEKTAAEERARVVTAQLADTVPKNKEVTTAIESVATAMEQMSSTVEEIARNGGEAADVVSTAVQVVGAAITTMANLSEASTQINEVVNTISQIARQTNLLALNATIEAARAGEAGKGFAVVAGEVKDLSSATQAATVRIGELIENVQALTSTASQDIARIAEIVNTVKDSQLLVAAAVEEQTVTNQEIARNLSTAALQAGGVAADLVSFLGHGKS